MRLLRPWRRLERRLRCGIIRKLQPVIEGVALLIGRNDAAVAKAEALAKEHSIKAVAYKVDGAYTGSEKAEEILTE